MGSNLCRGATHHLLLTTITADSTTITANTVPAIHAAELTRCYKLLITSSLALTQCRSFVRTCLTSLQNNTTHYKYDNNLLKYTITLPLKLNNVLLLISGIVNTMDTTVQFPVLMTSCSNSLLLQELLLLLLPFLLLQLQLIL